VGYVEIEILPFADTVYFQSIACFMPLLTFGSACQKQNSMPAPCDAGKYLVKIDLSTTSINCSFTFAKIKLIARVACLCWSLPLEGQAFD